MLLFCNSVLKYKWVPVTTAWRVLRLRVEEWPPIRRVAANILNKQSQTADEGLSSSLGVGWGANNASPWKTPVKKYSQGEMLTLETKQSGGKLLPHSDLQGGVFVEEVSHSRKRGGHLWIRWWTFGFHKVRGISWLAAEPVSFSRRTLLHGVSK